MILACKLNYIKLNEQQTWNNTTEMLKVAREIKAK
jgi:hypothetical protein